MPRSFLAVLILGLRHQSFALAAGPIIDTMAQLHFQSPKDKGTAELVKGKVGKAVRFTFAKGSKSAFFTSNIHGKMAWDQGAGFSFWVKGDGSDSFGGLELIYDNDYAVRYDYCFSIKNKEWTKLTVAWRDLVPVMPGARSIPLGGKSGNRPSRVSGLWFGKWWYWREYPAHSFTVGEIRLEEKIEHDSRDYRPAGKPLARVLGKLKAGKPITVVTIGDSLTDFHHWANRKVSWPGILKKQIRKKYQSKVAIINPAIGGTQLRQNLVLMPRWLAKTPDPDLVTFCFGGNDWEAGMRGKQFRESYVDAIDSVRRATRGRSDILILTTVPSLARWQTMAELAEACREAAKARTAGLADVEKAFLAEGKDKKERLFGWDKTHLGPVGHEVVADSVLKAIERTGK
jgi:lysophospholipase L1-like esterase